MLHWGFLQYVLPLVLPRFLNREPDRNGWQGVLISVAGLAVFRLWRSLTPPLAKKVAGVIFFLLFVGVGEELLSPNGLRSCHPQ